MEVVVVVVAARDGPKPIAKQADETLTREDTGPIVIAQAQAQTEPGRWPIGAAQTGPSAEQDPGPIMGNLTHALTCSFIRGMPNKLGRVEAEAQHAPMPRSARIAGLYKKQEDNRIH